MKKAHNSNCGTRRWIKTDACELRKGFRESVKGKWAEGDGIIERRKAEYDLVNENLRSPDVGTWVCNLVKDLNLLLFAIAHDIDLLNEDGKKLMNCKQRLGGALKLQKVC